jgi:hypothetical protein
VDARGFVFQGEAWDQTYRVSSYDAESAVQPVIQILQAAQEKSGSWRTGGPQESGIEDEHREYVVRRVPRGQQGGGVGQSQIAAKPQERGGHGASLPGTGDTRIWKHVGWSGTLKVPSLGRDEYDQVATSDVDPVHPGGAGAAGTGDGRSERGVGEPIDLERSRLLLVWLQSRRALDHALSEMLAAGPAGERRVRERFELVEHLVQQSDRAFAEYRDAVRGTVTAGRRRWLSAAPEAEDGANSASEEDGGSGDEPPAEPRATGNSDADVLDISNRDRR